MKKNYSNIKINNLPQSEIEIIGEIETSFFDKKFEETLKKAATEIEMPGFRKGHVPENIVLQKVGEMHILESAAKSALEEEYIKIIEEYKLAVIGSPSITLTKIARNNPLGFRIVIAILPTFSLPDYKKTAKEILPKKESVSVSEKEIDDVLLEIRKHHAHMELHKKENITNHDHKPIEEKDLSPLTDELIKEFGDFKDITDLKNKIKENLTQEKNRQEKEKVRLEIMENIIKNVSIDIPSILIENELDKMLAEFEGDISRSGLSLDEYLKKINKKVEDLRNEWKNTADKKVKIQLILSKISEKEKITPDSDEIKRQTEKILMIHRDADPLKVRIYVATALTNEKVFEFLENQS